jgi:hypothetical protein
LRWARCGPKLVISKRAAALGQPAPHRSNASAADERSKAMSVKLNELDGGKLLEVEVSGKLTKDDYLHFVPEFERLHGQHGKMRLMFEMKDFHGWDAGGLWEDIKFNVGHFADMDRVAMVGDMKWEKAMATICKPFTKAKVRYFDCAHAGEAREWLAAA